MGNTHLGVLLRKSYILFLQKKAFLTHTKYKLMKKIFIYLLAFSFIYGAAATIHTVDNKENSGADFTSLQEAIDAAAAGDTIYVSGSPVSYGSITIPKKLVLFGQGYNVNNQFGSVTEVRSVTFSFFEGDFQTPSTEADGSHLEGFYITSTIDITPSTASGVILSNITIRRNRTNFMAMDNASSIIIENNWMSNILDFGSSPSDVDVTNTIVRNNILYYSGSSSIISNAASGSILISNNLFIADSETRSIFGSCDNIIFTNNIVTGLGVGTTTSNCDFCTFTNNISFGAGATDFDYGTNTTGSNLEGVNPGFVNAEGFVFSVDADYRTTDTSPANDAGSDGTDIGIYGGVRPFPGEEAAGYFTSPFPSIPQVTEMNILNSSIPENGTLNVEFKAKKVN